MCEIQVHWILVVHDGVWEMCSRPRDTCVVSALMEYRMLPSAQVVEDDVGSCSTAS